VALAQSYHTPHRSVVQDTDTMCAIPSTPHVVPTRVISNHRRVLGFRIQQPTLAYELLKERGVMWTNFLESDWWLGHDVRATGQNVTSWSLLTPQEPLNIIYWARFWSLMHVEGIRWNLLVISLIINKISTYSGIGSELPYTTPLGGTTHWHNVCHSLNTSSGTDQSHLKP
jgi:hypothetical protein